MNLYEDQFSEQHDFAEQTLPDKVYVIASTGRSGSHMLGHALRDTGKFGFPLEYTNPSNLEEWKRRFNTQSLEEVFARIKSKRTSPNGVFGIKVHYHHLAQFGGFEGLRAFFPNAYYILLSRNDVLKQAVSMSIASQTGQWIAEQEATAEGTDYDGDQIDTFLRQIILDTASWRYTLAASGANYMELDFNSVRHDLSGTIQTLAEFIGIDIHVDDIPTQQVTSKQGNQQNSEWANRFSEGFDPSQELVRSGSEALYGKVKRGLNRLLK